MERLPPDRCGRSVSEETHRTVVETMKQADAVRLKNERESLMSPSGLNKESRWSLVLSFQCHPHPCATFSITHEHIQNYFWQCPLSPVNSARQHTLAQNQTLFCVPSENSMAPANTRAANSPTLNPAAATQFSITCGDRCRSEAKCSGTLHPGLCSRELARCSVAQWARFCWPGAPARRGHKKRPWQSLIPAPYWWGTSPAGQVKARWLTPRWSCDSNLGIRFSSLYPETAFQVSRAGGNLTQKRVTFSVTESWIWFLAWESSQASVSLLSHLCHQERVTPTLSGCWENHMKIMCLKCLAHTWPSHLKWHSQIYHLLMILHLRMKFNPSKII